MIRYGAAIVLAVVLFSGCGDTPVSFDRNNPADPGSERFKPVAPGELRVYVVDEGIRLEWRQGSPYADAVRIEKLLGGGDGPWQEIARLPSDSESFLDSDGPFAARTLYRVTSVVERDGATSESAALIGEFKFSPEVKVNRYAGDGKVEIVWRTDQGVVSRVRVSTEADGVLGETAYSEGKIIVPYGTIETLSLHRLTVSFVHEGEAESVVLDAQAEIDLRPVLRPYEVELEWIDERRLDIKWRNAWNEAETFDIFVRVGPVDHLIEVPSGETRAVFEHSMPRASQASVQVAAKGAAGSTARSPDVKTEFWVFPPTLSASSDSDDRTLRLSWVPAEDGVAPAGYRLERRLEDGSVKSWEFGAETTTLSDHLPGVFEEVEYRIGTLSSYMQPVGFRRITPYMTRAEFSAGILPILDLAFDQEGRVYAASGRPWGSSVSGRGAVVRYDPGTRRVDELLPALSEGYQAVAISPDEAIFAAIARSGELTVRDVSTNEDVWTTRGYGMAQLLFSPDSRHLIVVPSINQVSLYDARSGELLRRIGSTGNVTHFDRRQAAISPDGTTLFMGTSPGTPWRLEKWRVHDGMQLQAASVWNKVPAVVSTSASGEYVATGGAGPFGSSAIYRTSNLSHVADIHLSSPRFSRTGEDTVFGITGSRVISYDVSAGKSNVLANLSVEPRSIATSSDGFVIAVGFINGDVKIMRRSTEKEWVRSLGQTFSW
jgi:WD40 repeat protein